MLRQSLPLSNRKSCSPGFGNITEWSLPYWGSTSQSVRGFQNIQAELSWMPPGQSSHIHVRSYNLWTIFFLLFLASVVWLGPCSETVFKVLVSSHQMRTQMLVHGSGLYLCRHIFITLIYPVFNEFLYLISQALSPVTGRRVVWGEIHHLSQWLCTPMPVFLKANPKFHKVITLLMSFRQRNMTFPPKVGSCFFYGLMLCQRLG